MLEMEMLFSMFPNKGEISLQDKNASIYVQMYLKNIKGLPPQIEYSISIDIDELKVKVDLHVSLPHSYPHSAPQLFARSNALDRISCSSINISLLTSVLWIQVNCMCSGYETTVYLISKTVMSLLKLLQKKR